jgi:hypothetical protein
MITIFEQVFMVIGNVIVNNIGASSYINLVFSTIFQCLLSTGRQG